MAVTAAACVARRCLFEARLNQSRADRACSQLEAESVHEALQLTTLLAQLSAWKQIALDREGFAKNFCMQTQHALDSAKDIKKKIAARHGAGTVHASNGSWPPLAGAMMVGSLAKVE